MDRPHGVYTALVTPFGEALEIDWDRFDRLLELQRAGGVRGVVVGGTTAESPTLAPEELTALAARALERLPGSMEVIAGTGRSDPRETERLTGTLADQGIRRFLVVDPAYNAPSSAEIRREYLQPLAERHPDLEFLPYVVPGRTGARLLPVDLELARTASPNIVGVKDACGETEYSRELRRCLPVPFSLLSGDDGRAVEMIRDRAISANGLVSVVANVAPALAARVMEAARTADAEGLRRWEPGFSALAKTVSLTATEETPRGPVTVRVRNPVPTKALFGLLGASVGPCRPPLGRLTPGAFVGLEQVARELQSRDPATVELVRRHLGADSPDAEGAASRWRYDRY
ncbi:MAG: dihydrodipicolinate synthase family protein [Thermoplasmata archaeon]